MENYLQYSYIREWKEKMSSIIRMRFSNEQISDKKIDSYLNNLIMTKVKDPRILLVNNYTNKVSRLTTLKLIEVIRGKNLICAGGGCLFLQHKEKRNILIEFILYIMQSRNDAKASRKLFEKGSDEWDDADRLQLAFKLVINSLYGCLGYPGFIMFNIFLAEAITNQGKHIITTAINAIENFLGDSMMYETPNDVYNVINKIDTEFYSKTKGKFSDKLIAMIGNEIDLKNLPQMCLRRYLDHCIFAYSKDFVSNLYEIFKNMSVDELIMMYYKNNFLEFSRLNFMKEKIKNLILMNGPLAFCEDYAFKDNTCIELLEDIWSFYELFVLYDYPIYDRIRKAMYIDKTCSLYTDTDSVFVSLDRAVKYIKNEVFASVSESGMSDQNFTFTAANVILAIVNRMIAHSMQTLCRSLNITPEFAKMLKMKNEFFFSRIMFTDVKKRYISLALLQEGQVLNDGNGLPEIKGFDFIKAGTKKYVKDYYTKLCLEEILYPEEIKPARVFKKVLDLKYSMEDTISRGNMEFFKQANVKKPEYYKNPYSTQGVCAIILWNTLCPDKALEFPTDVNIVPIKELTFPKPGKGKKISDNEFDPLSQKGILEFQRRFPDKYDLLYKNIYSNSNPLIKHINLTSIAIPKNIDYEIPEHIRYLYNIENVINDNLNLILPILKSIGINSLQATTNNSYMSNIVSL